MAGMEDDRQVALNGFESILQKCEASLMPAIESHVTSEAFDSTRDGLDFLEVKNSLLLSYLIDLTLSARERVAKKHDEDNFRRLMETRTVLDKTRPLEKKMRYQLDKLLAATTTSFAVGNEQDPLTFRPNPNAMNSDDDDSSSSDDDSDDDDDEEEEMDDLEAARATLQNAGQSNRDENEEEEEEEDQPTGLYRAPRLASMPYTLEDDGSKERERRKNQRLRQSELAQTLRSEYGDAPEQADVHGGSDYGRQREAARLMAEREAEKTKMEEDHFIRLTTTRKEKKERKRLMREEGSNLAAIANMGNVVRGVNMAFGQDSEEDDDDGLPEGLRTGGRYGNGKRKRGVVDEATGRARKEGGRARQPKNEYQQALYGKPDKKSKKKRR